MRLQSSRPLNQAAILITLFTFAFGFSACVFEDFDQPDFGELTDLNGNTNIAALKALHTLGQDPTPIPAGQVLDAVVVGNDVSGNIFKELYVQDATGGLVIRLDVNGLNGPYPVGTPVVIRLDGLFIGDFNNKYQLTIADGERIPEAIAFETILPQSLPSELVEVEPIVVTIPELQNDARFAELQNKLIAIEGVQFVDSDAGVPFADVPGERDLNRTLRDCFGNEIVTRTSRFSDFAGSDTPTGNGRVVALLDVFGSTRQLKIREVTDFMLTGDRCGISVGGELIPISELRGQFSGSTTTASADTKIRGIVISDYTTGNVTGRNLFLQDGNAGIVIRFTENHEFPLGTDLEVSVSGLELSEFNGLLQVNNVPLNNAGDQGVAPLPTPREVDVATILANARAYESTLVTVDMATISGGVTFGGNLTVADASGSISMFTRSGATFAGQVVPTGEVAVTAIVSVFNDPQLLLRDADDVSGGMTGGGDPETIPASELRALFTSGATVVPDNRFVEGVVVSDAANGNTTGRNLVLQTGESGIVIRFTANHDFALNEKIRIDVSGQELSEFNGLLQVNNVPNENATSLGAGVAPTPREATVAEIVSNGEAWESTVVLIKGATLSGSSTYDGSLSVTDASGSVISMFTRGAASFSGENIPGSAVDLTAVVSDFNGTQIFIRNLDDVN